MGVINAETNLLIEKVPQSSGSHWVAADSARNRIYVPQSASDATPVGAGICGGTNGCVAVYQHHVNKDNKRQQHSVALEVTFSLSCGCGAVSSQEPSRAAALIFAKRFK